MGRTSRARWRQTPAEYLHVELLEERRLLSGRGDSSSGIFAVDANHPDEKTPSVEIDSDMEDGERSDVASGESHEGASEEESARDALESREYNEIEDVAGAGEVHDGISSPGPSADGGSAIQSSEDERDLESSSHLTGPDSSSSVVSSPVSPPVASDVSNIANAQAGNSASLPPTYTSPLSNPTSTSETRGESSAIEEAGEAAPAATGRAELVDESAAGPTIRLAGARHEGPSSTVILDVAAESARLAVAARGGEEPPSETPGKSEFAAPTMSATAGSVETRAIVQSAPIFGAAEMAHPNAEHPGQKEEIGSSDAVERGPAWADLVANKSPGSYVALLIPAQLPVAALVDAVLAATPQVAGLITDPMAIDMASIEREIDHVIGQIEGLRRELAGTLAALNLPEWCLAAAVGAAATEIVRLHRKRSRVLSAVACRDGSSSMWLPDSAGPVPEDLT